MAEPKFIADKSLHYCYIYNIYNAHCTPCLRTIKYCNHILNISYTDMKTKIAREDHNFKKMTLEYEIREVYN